jgi:flavin reductase (DIM6/NTAB) family NADH-FMN oxidoreductase RutF
METDRPRLGVTFMKQSLGAKTLAVPTPVWVVGSYDAEGRPNLMTAAWGGVCCSQPPCIYVSLRKATYTYGNLVARKAFTVSVPSEEHVEEADWIGIASGRDVDKFKAVSLTPVRSELVDAPYVAEFPLVIECRVIETVEIGLHTEFIGEILDVKAEQEFLSSKGNPDIEKIRPIIYSPGDGTYHAIGRQLGPAFSIGKNKFKS